MFTIPVQGLDVIVNGQFGNGDAQTQSTTDEAELQEQHRADDVDASQRDDPPGWGKMDVGFHF